MNLAVNKGNGDVENEEIMVYINDEDDMIYEDDDNDLLAGKNATVQVDNETDDERAGRLNMFEEEGDIVDNEEEEYDEH